MLLLCMAIKHLGQLPLLQSSTPYCTHTACLPPPTSPNCLSYPTTSSMISGLFIKNRSQLTLQGDAQLLLASPLRKLCICSEIFRFVFLESRTLKCHRSHGAGSVLVNAVHVRFLSGRVAAAAPQMNHRHTHTHMRTSNTSFFPLLPQMMHSVHKPHKRRCSDANVQSK